MFRSLLDRLFGSPEPLMVSDLLQFGTEAIWFEQMYSGVALLGATGSGKTSFIELLMQALAEHPAKPGILWCCAKSDEAERAAKVARRAGRANDFIRFSAEGSYSLDLFGYLRKNLKQSPDGIARFCDRMAGLAVANQGSGDDKTWQTQSVLMTTHALNLFAAAGQEPNPQGLFDVIVSVPKDAASATSEAFLKHSTCGQLIVEAQLRYKAGLLSPADRTAFERAVNYFLTYLPTTGDRFLGSVMATAVTGLSPFLQPPFSQLFAGPTTLSPDVLLEGAIVALDFPSVHGPNAFVAQAAFVQLAQMMLLRSPMVKRRPVVILRDECQWLVSPDWDEKVQTIARSHGIISISACQGHAPLIVQFGGDESARVRTQAFLGNHMTHFVFAPGSDIETRDHYVKLFGQSKQLMLNGGQQPNPNPSMMDRILGCDFVPTVGWSQNMLPLVPPEKFGDLKRGGRDHDYCIEAYLFQAGRRFSNGHPFLRIEFEQDLTP
jgi:TraM recognition site of TraD and TraG